MRTPEINMAGAGNTEVPVLSKEAPEAGKTVPGQHNFLKALGAPFRRLGGRGKELSGSKNESEDDQRKLMSRRAFIRASIGAAAGVGLAVAAPSILSTSTVARAEKRTPASLDFDAAVAPLKMTLQEMEANRQQIVKAKDIVDKDGHVTKQLKLHKNGYLYESHVGDDGKWTEYTTTSQEKIPIKNLNSFAFSEDGSVIVTVGEDPAFGNHLGIARSYDGGKTWDKASIDSTSGICTDINFLKETGNKFLISVGGLETDPGLQILTINPQTQKEQLTTAKTVLGKVVNTMVTSVDVSAQEMQIVAGKDMTPGLDTYTIDYKTGEVKSSNHISTLIINGQEIQLGYLYGRATYQDAQGKTRIRMSDPMNQVLYDFDPQTRQAIRIPYGNILDDISSPDYSDYNKGTLTAWDVVVVADSKGGVSSTWLLGGASFGSGSGHAMAVHLESRTPYILGGNSSALGGHLQTQSGKLNLETIVNDLGNSEIVINPDGTPDSNYKDPFYLARGIGSAPKAPALSRRAFLPALFKALLGGW